MPEGVDTLLQLTGLVGRLCFTAAGDLLLSAGDSGAVTVRSVVDLRVLHRLRAESAESPGGPGPLRCLHLSPVEDHLLVGTQRGTLLVWSTRASAGSTAAADAARESLLFAM